ncbi:hypothetical protein, unknown function [Leishmania infantum JPCM5]|uniref:RNA_recognition_motif._(A.k.a._RRM_-_RBD_-_or_RNP_domain)/RNA_recognition_motif_(A.k.a._RRM_-_RBD_-_or_RNP_domain)_-_putative n=3 Tax=Leishmania donovani species complex TaxID=38574 RepID=A0A6L0XEI3_LEIIN|nr:hypothetical protein, unknown function [Leishmania infantum JPCM5]XP_003860033.1 hypothetical protein, unknown function [Leishmania donovani]CAC9479650.1 RNA_recognition_motif._(a.k.a._RRM_-_RBD_-_or_RNP_domain)/RNA_recognition_motif_(a.k.a._RRM_-_RBD_-_or_RNP_domain)_-_putative [Leishmania infantum]AYU77945.1 RNA binding protein, putative [Leishmania donovani]CAM67072.1 hypothetical protein, unknown function [Leishmania infantum JPCM5]CBZ33326.1 hypothetical protein, unknown function [Leis|eukprot:XP_001464836.1 hypothetical protein, unknown function [Leishmania infantum JPCM5]
MSYKHNGGYHRGRPSVATAADSKLNLLVRFLDHGVDDSQFRVFFEPFGEITSSMVMRDIFTGESRGFGFVRFARSADAARALRECDGKRLGGKAVNVIWAKQQHDDTPAGQERLKMNKLFLRNVPLGVTEAELVALLRVYGTVTEASLHSDKIPAARHAPARRIAFIMFADEGAAEAALRGVHNTCPFPTCNGIPLMGKLSEDYKAKNGGSGNSSSNSSCQNFSAPSRAPAILFTDHAHLPPMLDCAFCTFTAKQVGGACSPTPASSVHLSDSAAEDSLFSPSAVVAGGSQADGVIAEQEAMARYSPALRLSTLRLPAPTLPKVFRHNPYAASLIAPRRNSG